MVERGTIQQPLLETLGIATTSIKLYSSRVTFLGRLSAVFLMTTKEDYSELEMRAGKKCLSSPYGRTERTHRDVKLEH